MDEVEGEEAGHGIVNMARCMQQATLRLVEEHGENNLAAWAAFVFHGFWQV